MSNFRSDFDNFKPGELHLRQKLLNREIKQPLDSRAIEISTFDVSADFLALGFSCVGITLTADNTGIWRNGTPGRKNNKELAEALKKALYGLVKKTLSTIPLWVAWVFERHKNGSPHIHAMLFCPVRDLAHVIALCKRLYDSKSVQVNVLSPMYVFKDEKWQWVLAEKNEDFPAALCSKILARTTAEIDPIKDKLVRRNVAKIKDVQTTKELHSVCNAKLRKKYPNAELVLGNLFHELWRYWKYAHCRSKRERVAEDVNRYDRLILGIKDENENETDDEPFPVNRFVITQPVLGSFGRDVACKLKTKVDDTLQQLDVTLWTKHHTERLHVNLKNIYLTKTQIHNLKLWAKKCRNKDDLLVLYRTLFSGKKIGGKDPLRMLDFAPKDLSDYDCELLENRFDIRSWLAYVFPLIRAQKQDDNSDFDLATFLATCGLDEFFRPIPEPAPPEFCSV
ncbi:hypothetical protein [uncultured Campylobacter sp.]|uniref:hypothetical protein n=1 Tax=uncultured Campylobacter sp. TaxID=218934 RepID=UPI0025D9305E|nr:hypothetical protein [uncultured Campylobacter sp.]